MKTMRTYVLSIILSISAAIVLSAATAVNSQAADTESAVKAAFVYNFFKYTDWPTNSRQTGSLTLCVTGDMNHNDSFVAIEGKQAGGRSLKVRFNIKGDQLKSCDALFISEESRQRTQSVLREVSGLPVLTISDNHNFVAHGGMIGLVQNGNRLGFEINVPSANSSGIHFSSHLLKLTKSVRGAK